MNRINVTILAIFICLFANADKMPKITISGITYEIDEKEEEAHVIDAEKGLEVVHIAEKIYYEQKDYPVTKISITFGGKWRWSSNSILREVYIPNSVKFLDADAFSKCYNLETLVVPDNPIPIEKKKKSNGELQYYATFYGCNSLSSIRCQNGSFPSYILSAIPNNCPFMLAQKYQQPVNNNNMYAQNVQQQPVQQQPIQTPKAEEKKPSSDVDINLPTTAENNDNTFAIIFANENYQEVAPVEYALNDGETFKKYCKSILGIPEKNIQLRKNATKNNMVADMSWIKDVADAYNGEAKFIIFYAGHGIPDEKSNEAFLLPVDGLANKPGTAYSMAQFYKELGSLNAANVTVFMDACFSGAQRGEGMLASARGVVITPRKETPAGNMVVFSAAQGDETAYPYKEKGHGLFTYYLLKKLRDTKGDCTLQELGDYIQTNVKRQSIVVNRKSQTPSVSASQQLATSWTTMKLR